MEIIILGFVLFILGVGATILYDKHKDGLKEVFQDLKAQQARTTTRTSTTRKPLSQKKKLTGPVTNNDVSINSTLTVEELIAKIESMKNRPGPKK